MSNGDDTIVEDLASNVKLMRIDTMKLPELREELKQRKLKSSGNKAELQERLRAAITFEIQHGEDDAEEEEEESEAESVVDARSGAGNNRTHLLTFRDVEEALSTFSGDDQMDIRQWIQEFEDMAKLCGWADVQRIIYAKRLLRGSAKLFVNYEKCSSSWGAMRRALIEEFGRMVDAYKIHKELSRRGKKATETYQEYVYKMFDIAKQAAIEDAAVIKYIIDGVQDEEVNKTILYGAKNIRELKEKFQLYETMKENAKVKSRRSDERQQKTSGRSNTTQEAVRRCFLCGDKNHLSAGCPGKNKGFKCFKCGQYGHIASSCSGSIESPKIAYTTSRDLQSKRCKEVEISNCKLAALIDTGSDLTLMRADQYVMIGAPKLGDRVLKFRGVGLDCNYTLGEFVANVKIDRELYSMTIHVVSDTLTQHPLLIGTDFLNSVEVCMKEGDISIHKVESNSCHDEALEVLKIDIEMECNRVDLSYITEADHRQKIENLINNYEPHKTREVNVKMNLILQDNIPVYQRPRRLSPQDKIEVDKQISEWMENGIVRASESDYASPIVLVKKKNGATRICVDYRQLNRKVIKDRYPLPLIEDQLDLLQDAKIFSTLDLRNGFFHVPIEESSIKYTAFVVPTGHYEFLKVPFGLCNSPAVFQKFINAVFKDLIAEKVVLTYMDDLIVPSNDFSQGIKRIELVLQIAAAYGLLINWEKCRFLQTRIEYLGHIVEGGSIQPSEYKSKAVTKFSEPRSVKDLQSFLGLTGYFRKFIYNYSIIARPLTNLLRKNVGFKFESIEREAFQKLKVALSNKPVLRLYNVGAETQLHTDACSMGYGAILLQRDSVDGAFHPIYFASGKTSVAEEKYASYELEVLAIVKALKKFRVYLLGIAFKIITDCQAFALTMRKKDLCVRVARWALLLEEFDYQVEHRAGSSMRHVDALSRHPLPAVMAIEEDARGIIARLKRAQVQDDDLRQLRDDIGRYEAEGYRLRNELLYKEIDDVLLVVVPRSMRIQIVRQAHELGHFGITKTEALVRRDYWFKGMRHIVERVVRNCVNCILAERKHGKPEGMLHTIDKGEIPFETYHVDHLGPLASTKKSYKHIFAVVDAFSKFVWLYATKSTSSAEVITRLKKQSVNFGNPRRIISDRGTAFTSTAFEGYCQDENIEHVLITTGIPRANGQIERVNRSLIPLLTKLSAPNPEQWYRHLDVAQKYLNATPSRSTKATPFQLLFGTHMKMRENPQIRQMIEEEWVMLFEEERDQLRAEARENISRTQAQNRKDFNKKRKKATTYSEEDLVAIRRTQAGPGLKFCPKFLGPYRVTAVLRGDRYLVEKVGEHEGPQATSTAADNMKLWTSGEETDSVSEISDNSDRENI